MSNIMFAYELFIGIYAPNFPKISSHERKMNSNVSSHSLLFVSIKVLIPSRNLMIMTNLIYETDLKDQLGI